MGRRISSDHPSLSDRTNRPLPPPVISLSTTPLSAKRRLDGFVESVKRFRMDAATPVSHNLTVLNKRRPIVVDDIVDISDNERENANC
ncbi:hypothetical protein GGF37_006754, partial [Kickxella alabastrina]